MRYALPCPACGGSTRFIVVRGELQASCRRCAVRAEVLRWCCEGAPAPGELTDLGEEPICVACAGALKLTTGAIRAPTALAGDDARDVPEPRWGPLTLSERTAGSPYRDERCGGLSVRRPSVGVAQVVMVTAGFGWPAIPVALLYEPAWALAWVAFALTVGVLLVFGARPVQALEADPTGLRVRHGGFLGRERQTRAAAVRRVFWAGRGARCAVWAQTERDHALLFDGLDPHQAASLERKLEQVLGLDAEDRSALAEARAR